MGNAESGCGAGSGDEEDVETESPVFAEGSPASAATGTRAGNEGGGGNGGGGGGGAAAAAAAAAAAGSGQGKGVRSAANPPAPIYGLPTPEALLEQVKLREAAARMSDSWVAISESVLARNESALVRWLEERLSRGEESVTLEQFCEMLETRDATREECEEVRRQATQTSMSSG